MIVFLTFVTLFFLNRHGEMLVAFVYIDWFLFFEADEQT